MSTPKWPVARHGVESIPDVPPPKISDQPQDQAPDDYDG